LVFVTEARWSLAADERPVIELFPDGAPGEKGDVAEEADLTKESDGQIAGKRLIRLGHVSKPTITIYPAPADKNTGTAVLVCPGGAYHILALDLEGSEVCEWLNSIGVTGVLLKYRVPRRDGREMHAAPLEDAQRAMGILRSRAAEFGIDPHRIGVLGFSAGGHLAAAVSTNTGERGYDKVDEADDVSSRPDFSVLIYPAYLVGEDKKDVEKAQVVKSLPINKDTPPTFIAMAQDDPVGVKNALGYAAALNQAGVPMEVHIYPQGGHGYGLRRTELPVTGWPDRAEDWMKSNGWLDAAATE
jgi:acetyl esterase/lipase